MNPLLSIVIPTFNRTDMLDRAIESALNACGGERIEVVVVPNGPHRKWEIVKSKYCKDDRVKWFHIDLGNACAARNYGLANSKGLYVRFLDDDDYLLPSSAEQLKRIKESGADISVAPLVVFNQRSGFKELQGLPETKDFVCAVLLSISISNMTAGCIFLKSAIGGRAWREDVVLHDDYLWMLGFGAGEEKLVLMEFFPVAVYVQHDAERLSRVRRTMDNSRVLVNSILLLHQDLLATGRGSPERSSAVAAALLTHAHSVFPLAPIFFGKLIKKAQKMDSNAHPMQSMFIKYPWLARKLLVIEWVMLGPRYITRGYRRISWWLRSASLRGR
ncbi:glycosyltransferase family 2 protein [Azovibrio restrictus]|uniref:glycosyltransferase family 2 protein n=1 Tax=Azovibrio restrictus TaxID=146938 RepID=UPI00146FC046|nr:glycosyltransferase family 2 protein [Azovibrio restrictus]